MNVVQDVGLGERPNVIEAIFRPRFQFYRHGNVFCMLAGSAPVNLVTFCASEVEIQRKVH